MGEVVPARTLPTLHPPSPPTVHQLSRLALLRVNTCDVTIEGTGEGPIEGGNHKFRATSNVAKLQYSCRCA